MSEYRQLFSRPSPLRARRLLRGLRLRDVGRAADVPDTTLSRLERGELPLIGPWLRKLAAFYATPPDALRREMERFAAGAERECESRAETP